MINVKKEEKLMRTIGFIVAGLMLVAGPMPSHAAEAGAGAGTVASPVKVKVPAAIIAKANNPAPPAEASKKTSIGKGKTAVNTSNGPGDDDSFWVEQIDVDGDGDVESTDVIWDDEDRVLFLYSENNSLVCADGGAATADLLVAINGKGNARKRPAGSGWYLVSLDETECKAEAAETYGCRFDTKGNPTACGVAVVDEKNDDIIIATASE
jgi:hypothetical protein